MTSPTYVVIIPSYNGGDKIGSVIKATQKITRDIIVVDDGSTDNTETIANTLEVLKVLRWPNNQGKGAALSWGLEYAREQGFDLAITIDSDGQHDPAEIPGFLEAWEKNKPAVLIGNRFADQAAEENMPRVRYLSNRISSRLISWVLGCGVPDLQCGYRLYDLKSMKKIKAKAKGFSFETEILSKVLKRKLGVESVPISCQYPDGISTSRYRPLWDSLKIFWAVIRR